MEVIAPVFTMELARTAGLALALFAGAGVAGVPAALTQSEPTGVQGCALSAPEIEAEPWVRTELFFGTARPDGSAVTEAEWNAFLDEEITPRFPDGLTVFSAYGQYREDDQIIQEDTQVLIILYPSETAAESSALLEEIRDEYEQQFEQSSVLRADITPVCTSF